MSTAQTYSFCVLEHAYELLEKKELHPGNYIEALLTLESSTPEPRTLRILRRGIGTILL